MIKKISLFFIVFVPVFLLIQAFLFDTQINSRLVVQALATGILAAIIFFFLERQSRK